MGKQLKLIEPEPSAPMGRPRKPIDQRQDDDIVLVSVRVTRAVRKRWFIAAFELDVTMIELVTKSVERYLAKQAKKRSKAQADIAST